MSDWPLIPNVADGDPQAPILLCNEGLARYFETDTNLQSGKIALKNVAEKVIKDEMEKGKHYCKEAKVVRWKESKGVRPSVIHIEAESDATVDFIVQFYTKARYMSDGRVNDFLKPESNGKVCWQRVRTIPDKDLPQGVLQAFYRYLCLKVGASESLQEQLDSMDFSHVRSDGDKRMILTNSVFHNAYPPRNVDPSNPKQKMVRIQNWISSLELKPKQNGQGTSISARFCIFVNGITGAATETSELRLQIQQLNASLDSLNKFYKGEWKVETQ